jgi:hypothetical protein
VNAQTGAGVDRYLGMSIRAIPGSFLFRSKMGNLWAAVRQGAENVLLYLLKRQVHFRPRRTAQRTIERGRPAVMREMNASATLIVAFGNGRA